MREPHIDSPLRPPDNSAESAYEEPTLTNFDEVLDAARALPTSERLRLINALWDNLPPEEWPAPSAEWIAEAQRRSAEYDAGRMSAAPWSELRERARRKAGLDG
jgi:putative addiction module component (TIGR02574 family)